MERLLCSLLLISCFAYTTVHCESTLLFKPKTKCHWYGNVYTLNQTNIPHPINPCKECKCCETGKVKCMRRDCAPYNEQPPPCGEEFRKVIDEDGCCETCNDQCKHYKTEENCPPPCEGPLYYPPGTSRDSCCGVCGACPFRGHVVPEGPTCFKGNDEIRAGEIRSFGNKFCFCMTDPIYWPLAVCGNKNHEGNFERMLQKQMCVKKPENPVLWNDDD
ncbi:kielin/chordin-like protein isoform X2 [Ruditapes philippinarum]|uniref:kielin/chordin-like protein isoform X2 n=1 Tax=Ruditapes philippinarum TaxID=129788 RepID=UPI00295BFAC4|nr:kielin/chordin-like protein isoform X2 [Ruditapes philippinarum]